MLKIRFKNNKDTAVWLVEPQVNIGRARDCELALDAPGIEDKHLQIKVNREQLELVNLVPESTVQVNGRAVSGPQPLVAKDVISLCGVELEIIDPKHKSAASSQQSSTANHRIPKATGWALKANHRALQNRVYPLKAHNTVGRSSECDISLSAAHLSRRHAEFRVLEGVLYVKDLGSANGTYVNGKPITETRLKRGDELCLDTLSFGVIGPTEDMDKTTVRSVSRPGAARAHPSHKPNAAHKPQVATPPPASKPRYGFAGLALLAALTVVVVVALYLTRR